MKKYRNDYRKKGNRYEYTGQWYRTRLSEQDLRKTVLSSMSPGHPGAGLLYWRYVPE